MALRKAMRLAKRSRLGRRLDKRQWLLVGDLGFEFRRSDVVVVLLLRRRYGVALAVCDGDFASDRFWLRSVGFVGFGTLCCWAEFVMKVRMGFMVVFCDLDSWRYGGIRLWWLFEGGAREL